MHRIPSPEVRGGQGGEGRVRLDDVLIRFIGRGGCKRGEGVLSSCVEVVVVIGCGERVH